MQQTEEKLDVLTMLDFDRGKRSVTGRPRAKQAISVIGTTELLWPYCNGPGSPGIWLGLYTGAPGSGCL